MPGELQLGVGLARILRMPEHPRSSVLAVATLLTLCEQVRQDLGAIDGISLDLYVAPISTLESRLSSIHHREQWNSARQHFDEALLTAMRFCADTLNHRVTELSLSTDELASISQHIDQIEKHITTSGIDAKLKSILLLRVHQLREAIALYRAGGASAIEQTLDALIGSIAGFAARPQDATPIPTPVKSALMRVLEQVKLIQDVLINTDRLVYVALPAAQWIAPLLT